MKRKTTYHRRTRPDRLTAPDLIARKKAIEIDDLLKPLILRKQRADQKWGYDRLLALVPTEWARQFGIAHEKLEQALIAEDPDTKYIADRADNLIKAYNKLDQIATDSGAEASPEAIFHLQVGERPAVIALDRSSQQEALRVYPDHLVYTVEEVEKVLAARELEFANKAKEIFKGAEIVDVRKANKPPETAKSLDQDIPF